MIKCKNCGHLFEGRYCNYCGQSAKTDRINSKFLWEDIEHGILHYDKGMAHTIKQLFSKPGFAIKDYINGKRVHHFRPISLCIVLATLYGFIYHLTNVKLINTDNNDSVNASEEIFKHYYWFVFITIPIYAFSTKIIFRQKEYNFWEYFILESFKVAQRLFIHVLSLPVIYMFYNSLNVIMIALTIIDITLIIWTNIQFFNKLPKFKVIYLSILSYLLFFVIVMIMFFILLPFVKNF